MFINIMIDKYNKFSGNNLNSSEYKYAIKLMDVSKISNLRGRKSINEKLYNKKDAIKLARNRSSFVNESRTQIGFKYVIVPVVNGFYNPKDAHVVDEGWKDKVLGAAMVAGSILPSKALANNYKKDDLNKAKVEQTHKTSDTKGKVVTLNKKASNSYDRDRLIERNWSLDSVKVDTIWREVKLSEPETIVNRIEIRLDDNQYFESGKFMLNDAIRDSIDKVIGDILSSNGIITSIKVESSTDKQQLSSKTKDVLGKYGYERSNKGLAEARSEQITKYLNNNMGINDSLITINNIIEGGSGEIDLSARYVTIKIVYLDEEVRTMDAVVDKIPEFKETYYLSKQMVSKKVKSKLGGKGIKLRSSPIKIGKTNTSKCFNF